MTFGQMIDNGTFDELSDWLNSLTPEQRLEAIRSLNKSQQRKLYQQCANTTPLSNAYYCGEVGEEVIHEGKNSLPAFTEFQKRFVKLEDGRVVGYNHGSTMGLIGPGYFVLKETAGNPDWTEHGSVVVDYYEQLPTNTPVPAHWPKIKGNHQGLQMFVYNNMHDFMRRVSDHVSIGAAFKKGNSIDSYFLLCRQ